MAPRAIAEELKPALEAVPEVARLEIAGALFTVLSFTYLIAVSLHKLPQDVSGQPDAFIPNPLHLLPAVIFLIALPRANRGRVRK